MTQVTPQQLARQAATLELINSEVSASLARQAASGKRLDTLSILLAGYAGAAAAFLATRPFQLVLAVVAFCAFTIAAGFSIWAYSILLDQDVPEPRRLFADYLTTSRTKTLAALAASRVAAFEGNASKRASKARRWWIGLALAATGMAFMIPALATR